MHGAGGSVQHEKMSIKAKKRSDSLFVFLPYYEA
jgi:hypothetical protein